MSSIVIGDLHGRSVWEEIPGLLTYDQIIFIGDYVDAKEGISEEKQIANFFKVLEFKKSNPGKVVLLVGNHDYHYFPFSKCEFSGFSQKLYSSISEIFEKEYQNGLFEAAFLVDHFLISHAGVTKTWYAEHIGDPKGHSPSQVVEAVSSKWKTRPDSFDFDHRPGASPDGDNIFQSPFIVRPNSILRDGIPLCIQIVGHTQVQNIKKMEENLILCDCLGFAREVLIIKDSKFGVLEF